MRLKSAFKSISNKREQEAEEERRLADLAAQRIEDEKKREIERRNQLREIQYKDYLSGLENKKVNSLVNQKEKQKKSSVSVELNHEKRINEMKGYFNNLSTRVDRNAEIYKNYMSGNPIASPKREATQEIQVPSQLQSKNTEKAISSPINANLSKINNPDYFDYVNVDS